MTRVVYLAHPVAPTEEQIIAMMAWRYSDMPDSIAREKAIRDIVRENLVRARCWLRFLVDNTDWAICAAWMPYVEALNDATSSHRARGLRDDCAMAARCDAIILCGGRISSGMAQERDAVIAAGGLVLDLGKMGPLPPATDQRELLTRIWDELAWMKERATLPPFRPDGCTCVEVQEKGRTVLQTDIECSVHGPF
jgi:hypothetical protein